MTTPSTTAAAARTASASRSGAEQAKQSLGSRIAARLTAA